MLGPRHATPRHESGFAIPFVLFVVTLVTLMLASAFTRTTAEFAVAAGSDVTVTSLAVARTGLEAFLGNPRGVRPLPGDSTRHNVVGGYAWVVPQLLQSPVGDSMLDYTYVIRSTGYVIDPNQGATPVARRSVARFARWQQGSMSRAGALTALNHLGYAPAATVVIDGTDACGGPPIPGYRAPIGGDVPPAGGSPATEVSGTLSAVANEVGIDWDAVRNGAVFSDYPAVRDGDTTYATYVIDGNVGLEDLNGTGLLIVTGELDTGGAAFLWRGVILVGGEFDPDAAATTVRGLVVSGLNRVLGYAVNVNEFDDPGEDIDITYDSCEVSRALASLRGFVPVEKAWVDNWATY